MREMILKAISSVRARVFECEPRIPLSDRISFYSRLSLYLRSGIPIRIALGTMRDSAKRKGLRQVITSADAAVLDGMSLARALGMFPRSFPLFETHLIGLGERSGSLSENLAYVASLLTQRRILSRKIRSALLYPCIIVLGTVSVTGFLLFYTFPKIVPIFHGLNVPLPFTTRLLIGTSDLISHHGILICAFFVLVIGLTIWSFRYPTFRRKAEQSLFVTPILGNLIRTYNLALVSRTLTILLSSGISLVPALELVGNGTSHSDYRQALKKVGDRVAHGTTFSSGLAAHARFFPHTLVDLVAAGEATGSLSRCLGTAAELYEDELAERTRTLMTLIEPVLMITMGMLVGFVSLAIITPVYGITQNLTLH